MAMLFIWLLYLSLLALLSAIILYAYRSKSPVTRHTLIYSVVATIVILVIEEVNLKGPTAKALRPIFLPFDALAIFVVTFVFFWTLVYIIRFVSEKRSNLDEKKRITNKPVMIIAVVVLCIFGYFIGHKIYRNNILKRAEFSHSAEVGAILNKAISTHDIEVLSKLAKNSNTPAINLIRIFDTCKKSVRDYSPREYIVFDSLALNPNTPQEVLVILAESRGVRDMVATNPNTPAEILRRLSKDSKDAVRYQVARNPNTPIEILETLSQDSDNLVREEAVRNYQRPR
jgi:hypothetical protein